ncbi:MAG: sulfotransferase [Candidatus Hodarchaeota archaeon]
MKENKMQEIKPIIVIGMNRSGTKWLSNILCNHPDVVGVQSEKACGIHESIILNGTMEKKFDITYPEDYVAAIELLALSRFFDIARGSKEYFYRLNPRPTCLYDVFKILMENFALCEGKKFWLQKTEPRSATKVMDYFKEGYFIVIRRNIVDTLKSTMKMASNVYNRQSLARAIYFYVLRDKILDKICNRKRNVMCVRYEELVRDPEAVVSGICKFIGINFNPSMLEVRFRKNTSFGSSGEKVTFFSETDKMLIRTVSSIMQIIPFFAMNWMVEMWGRMRGVIHPFRSGTYKHILEKYSEQQ